MPAVAYCLSTDSISPLLCATSVRWPMARIWVCSAMRAVIRTVRSWLVPPAP